MGLRTRLARWLNGSEPLPAPVPSVPAVSPFADLDARVKQLELERPAFILELESLLDTAQEILGRAEGKRGRLAAEESRRKKAAEQPEQQLDLPPDREQVKAEVRRRLAANGHRVQ